MDFSVSNFIWLEDPNGKKYEKPLIVSFRKTFRSSSKIKISANCRYKLYINGQFLQEGPQKGNSENAYVDTAEFSHLLNQNSKEIAGEENEILVKVLYYPENPDLRNDSLYYSMYPCLYVEDITYEDVTSSENSKKVSNGELDGKSGWLAREESNIEIVGEAFFPAPIHGAEIVHAGESRNNWKPAFVYNFFQAQKPDAPFHLINRTIPNMEHRIGKFQSVVCVRNPGKETEEAVKAQWNGLIQGKSPVKIGENQTAILELDAGEETCAYPSLMMIGGEGASIKILYSEGYGVDGGVADGPTGPRKLPPVKTDRTDFIKGQLFGNVDLYEVSGSGTTEGNEIYEPYLFRTFRFVRLQITTKNAPITITSYDFLTTGYPLEVKNHPISEKEDFNKIWDISLRTLKRCMHETYVDCPFYEQLQYAMDSRAEILFTYEVSEDDRLARQTMEAFRTSQRTDGMTKASSPSQGTNVIPGFSIFYLMMVYDHMKYFGDRDLVEHHFNCIEGILQYFKNTITAKGLVGNVGGILFQHQYWSFVDWCPEWGPTIGVPAAKLEGDGSLTFESLLYLYGLQRASDLARFIGRSEAANFYTEIATQLAGAIRRNCIGKDGLLQDGPGVELYSTHCQVWGILTGILTKEEGRKNLEKTYQVAGIPQCSVSMSFYLMEAMDQVGILKEHDDVWNPWREMLENNLTTCVENYTDQRSDCHAWGAIMLYALHHYYEDSLV